MGGVQRTEVQVGVRGLEMRVNGRYVRFTQSSKEGKMGLIFELWTWMEGTGEQRETLCFG